MARSKLPPKPDFAALQTAAERSAPQRQSFLALIGELNFAWSNDESLFIYVLMLLLETDERSAAIVFATLNTTRARLDLVQRLAKAKVTEAGLRREIEAVVAEFSKATALRNEFNHAVFVVSPEGEITHTQSTRLQERGGRLAFGARQPIGAQRLQEIGESIHALTALNGRLWDLLTRLEAAMATGSAADPG